jgi:hypothetical protein
MFKTLTAIVASPFYEISNRGTQHVNFWSSAKFRREREFDSEDR